MGAYLGHLEGQPKEQFLAIGHGFQEALDAVDMLAQPDESSVRPVTEPLTMRLRLSAVDEMLYIESRADPFPIVNRDLMLLRAQPGTGSTGDVLRSYGPRCEECGFQHFDNQECKVFLESIDELDVVLLADPRKPGEAALAIHIPDHLEITPTHGMLQVADLGELDFMAVFPFTWTGRRYSAIPGHACIDGSEVELYQACVESGIKIPKAKNVDIPV